MHPPVKISGEPEHKVIGKEIIDGDAVVGAGGHWIEREHPAILGRGKADQDEAESMYRQA
jgi:hypothetical protein